MLQLRSSFGKAFSRKKRQSSVNRSNSIGSARVDASMSHTWSMPTISDPNWVAQRYQIRLVVHLMFHIDYANDAFVIFGIPLLAKQAKLKAELYFIL